MAAEFLQWLAVPANARWLDVGCGTGALSETILERAAPQEVVGIDAAEPFVDFRTFGSPFEIGTRSSSACRPHAQPPRGSLAKPGGRSQS